MKLRNDLVPRLIQLIHKSGVRAVALKSVCGVGRFLNLCLGQIRKWHGTNDSGGEAVGLPLGVSKAGANVVKGRTIMAGILAGVMLFAPQAAVSDSASHAKLVGTYQSRGSKKDPFMNLSLGADGSATLDEDPGSGALVFFGHWTDSGSQVTVIFNAADGEPAEPPMIFDPIRDGFQAATWNHARWGKVTPPPMKKGWKVKEKYWFTTVR